MSISVVVQKNSSLYYPRNAGWTRLSTWKNLRIIYNRLNNLNTDQEFVHYGKGPILPDEYTALGEFRASIKLADHFRGNNPLSWITGWGPKFGRTGFLSGDAALVFVDNHDIQRKRQHSCSPTPRVMSSYSFTDHELGPPDHNEQILPVVIKPEMIRFNLALFLFGLVTCDHSKTNQWANRSTIVHLFEWKWKDVAEECERFLAPKGYGAVQISPPSENLIIRNNGNRPWYERYQVMSYQLVTRSGGEEELLDMTRRCNRVGVRIYADVVINHMTGNAAAGSVGTGGSTADFDHYHYPAVPYVADNFHSPHCDINDYRNVSEVRKCQLVSLKDLNQSQEVVRNHIVKYLNHLIKLGVAGFRVDASKHMDPRDLREIYSRLDNITDLGAGPRRPYVYQEVIYYGGEPIRPDEYTPLGDVTEFRVGNELKNVFRGHNAMKWLRNWGEDWGLSPSGTALAFIDNHDTQRTSDVLTYKEPKAYKAAVAFMLAHPYGTPRVMSSYHFDNHEAGPPSHNEEILSPTIHPDGTCGNGWVCEHRWRQIYQMVGFRNAVGSAPVSHWWDNGSKQIAFARENRGFIVFNGEFGVNLNVSLKTSLPQGVYCDVISGEKKDGGCTGKTISVNKYSDAHFYIPKDAEDMHIAIHVGSESKLY